MANFHLAQSLAKGCKSCKEIESIYKTLLENGFEKESAKNFIKSAKESLKSAKAENKTEKDFIKGWFSDFEKVGKSLLIGICKEDGIKFSDILSKFDTIESFIAEFVTKADSFGKPIRKSKGEFVYKSITANNIRSILRECVTNYNSALNGFSVAYLRIESAQISD